MELSGWQLYVTVGLPIVAVLTSLTVSLVPVSSIREDMRELRKEFADLRKDMNTGLSDMRREAREDRLQIAADIKLLTGKVYEIMGQK
jgi:hypothetical protein